MLIIVIPAKAGTSQNPHNTETGTVIPAKAGTSQAGHRHHIKHRHPGEGRDLMKFCTVFGWDSAKLLEVPAFAGMTVLE